LTNGTAYTFTVQAINSVGTGPASVQTNAVTPVASPTVPTPPLNLVATAGVLKATVAFSPPASNGGDPITGYTVKASTGQTGTGTASPIVVNGLAAGTAVNFTATATNAVGNSTASAASNTVTPTAALTISSPVSGSALPGGVIGTPYSQTFTAANDTPADTWSASGLPTGLGIASSGTHTAAITGTPGASGNFSPSVTVKDTTNQSYTAGYSLNISNGTGGPGQVTGVYFLYQGMSSPASSGGTDPVPSAPNTQAIAWTQASAGAFPIAYNKIYRGKNGIAPTLYYTSSTPITSFVDTPGTGVPGATTCVASTGPNVGSGVVYFPANGYYYQISAVDTQGNEGPLSTGQIFTIYNNGPVASYDGYGIYADYNNLVTSTYNDTSGSPPSETYDVKNVVTGAYGDWLPYSGCNATHWNLWVLYAFNYLNISIKPTVAGQLFNMWVEYRTGPAPGVDPNSSGGGQPVVEIGNNVAYGPNPMVANQWNNYKVPLSKIMIATPADGGGRQGMFYKLGLGDQTGRGSNTYYVSNYFLSYS
jgi:hypothetical protein